MQQRESTFTGQDGLELYYQWWQPETETKAVLMIVHGLGEHSGRYMNLVQPLSAAGYAIYAFDNRGHGRSPGKRGYINSFEEYRQDVVAFQGLVKEWEGERPLFIMGHSLGGLITLLHPSPRQQWLHGNRHFCSRAGHRRRLCCTHGRLKNIVPHKTRLERRHRVRRQRHFP
ncbi:MAG: lysophospholipase [Chloroflexi bacterium]|nr:lysophospholipase [Chloroflexota bacterium]